MVFYSHFDVFDPALQHTEVPVAVHDSIVYAIEDMNQFKNMNKTEAFNDGAFREKLKGTVTKFVKGVVSNAPSDAQIPVVQLERKIMQISNLVVSYVCPKVEKTFSIVVRSLDITEINVDQDSRGYRELQTEQTYMYAHRANLHADALNTAMHTDFDIFKQPQPSADMNKGKNMGTQMGGMNMGAMNTMGGPPDVQFMLAVYDQQARPYNMQQLQQHARQGQINAQKLVWKQGMTQWLRASQVPELQQILAMVIPPMPDMPQCPECNIINHIYLTF